MTDTPAFSQSEMMIVAAAIGIGDPTIVTGATAVVSTLELFGYHEVVRQTGRVERARAAERPLHPLSPC